MAVYQLKHPIRNCTTHVLFEPLGFVARPAALVPRPRIQLVRYHGLFALHAEHRDKIVARPPHVAPLYEDVFEAKSPAAISRMQRLRRVFAIDISARPRCGGIASLPV